MFKFSFKIIFSILNKPTQYISFLAIALFFTIFLLIQQLLNIYEDKFINSLKGLYPKYITSSKKVAARYNNLPNLDISKEIFVYAQEIGYSYKTDGEEITKYMNVRSFDKKHKQELFEALDFKQTCNYKNDVIYLSNKLYQTMLKDSEFDKKHVYFIDNNDTYKRFNLCTFYLANNEKWLVLPTEQAKKLAYMPLESFVFYTDDKEVKNKLDHAKKVYSWRDFIDYDDLGIFLISKDLSKSFLVSFFIFLISFIYIVFSSIAKEFRVAVFLQKFFGLNFKKSFYLYGSFFLFYIFCLNVAVILFYLLASFGLEKTIGIFASFNLGLFLQIDAVLFVFALLVSYILNYKYHRFIP